MIFALILIIVGAAVGLMLPLQAYAISSSIYTSVGILAAIDSIIGGIKANYDEEFDLAIFASGLFLNILMAVALSWVGDKIGVPLYFAAVFVFGTRLFNNLALIRRRVIERIRRNLANKRRFEAEGAAESATANAAEVVDRDAERDLERSTERDVERNLEHDEDKVLASGSEDDDLPERAKKDGLLEEGAHPSEQKLK